MIIQTNSKSTKCSVATHTANVDGVADDEPQDRDCGLEEDTTETNPQDTNKQKNSSQDADSNPFFDSVHQKTQKTIDF